MLTDQSGPPAGRMSAWKTFRDEIKDLSEQEQLNKVAEYFSRTPIGVRSIDFYSPDSWPDPWEIIYQGSFCQNSISLLMYYTLKFLPHYDREVELWLIETKEDRFLVPVVEGQDILNYELGAISTWQQLSTHTDVIEKFNEQLKQYS